MKDKVARELAQEAYDKAMRVYSGVKTGCYDGGCDAYSRAINNQLYVKSYELDAVKADAKRAYAAADRVAGQVGRMAIQMAELQRRIEELEGKKKPKVCKHCGQEKA